MDDRLASYVTNLDRDVFALRNLPEEVVAVLFAYYSRSRDDLRTNLRRLLDDRELAMLEGGAADVPALATARDRAKAFHEKWVVGYGHASVAEHAVVHLAVERCSIVAAKALEEARLAAYTEKSTRYVRFDEGTLVTDIGLPPDLEAAYEKGARALLRTYAAVADGVEAALIEKHPPPEGTPPKAHAAVLRAHACDLLRGLLPAGVPTNVGVTLNARGLEQHVGRMLGSPLAEVRRIGDAMRHEGAAIVPTLLKYTAPRKHRDGAYERVLNARGALHAIGDEAPHSDVRLIDGSDEPLRTLAAAIQCELFGVAWDEAWRRSSHAARARQVVDAYLADRGPHDQPLRALEQVTFRFEVCCDYGAWRDLQRHRMVSATTPRLGTSAGWWLSPELAELGFEDVCRDALEAAVDTHARLAASHPWEAQYAVPLAFRVRYVMHANLREMFHLIELRSARQGHESYRRVAQGLAECLLSACPWLATHLRVDRNQYPWARH
jgi:thymidylate synthase ThyX